MVDPFPSTHWSLVLAARKEDPGAGKALASLCEIYWFPVYTYVRRRAESPDEAKDLVQQFFVELIEKRYLDIASPEAGRFRAFLLHKVKHFLAGERERTQAQKRGGGARVFRLDTESAERRFLSTMVDNRTPEIEFEKRWAATLVDHVMERLGEEASAKGKESQFMALRPFLTEGGPKENYREVGASLGMTEQAVRSAVHRLRRRFGDRLREEVGNTVADPADVDDELRHLLQVLA